jgi:hypothetical protein
MIRPTALNPYDVLPPVAPMTLTSADVVDGERLPRAQVFDGLGYGGGNRSAQLSWLGQPDATLGFAVTCFDPDAPTGSGFWHWVMVDVPATVTQLAPGAGAEDWRGISTPSILPYPLQRPACRSPRCACAGALLSDVPLRPLVRCQRANSLDPQTQLTRTR